MKFKETLSYGVVGESLIANWFRSQGYSILPVYEVEINTGKGPRLSTPAGQLIAPDMFIFKSEKAFWIEAKHKNAFSWHRLTKRWVTGIDICHYEDYCIIDNALSYPVWLMFLHRGGQAKDSPGDSPSGLFGKSLEFLRCNENHRSSNWGKTGMVYWDIASLEYLAPLKDIYDINENFIPAMPYSDVWSNNKKTGPNPTRI